MGRPEEFVRIPDEWVQPGQNYITARRRRSDSNSVAKVQGQLDKPSNPFLSHPVDIMRKMSRVIC